MLWHDTSYRPCVPPIWNYETQTSPSFNNVWSDLGWYLQPLSLLPLLSPPPLPARRHFTSYLIHTIPWMATPLLAPRAQLSKRLAERRDFARELEMLEFLKRENARFKSREAELLAKGLLTMQVGGWVGGANFEPIP